MNQTGGEQGGFAEQCGRMTDGELLKLAAQPWAMSGSAWDALEDELDRRGLDIPEPESPPNSEFPAKRNRVVLRRFRDLPEAMLAKGKLDSEGVESFLADDNTVRMDWLWSNLLGGIKLLVNPEDAAAAIRSLEEPIPEQIDFEGAADYQQPRCPRCQSLDINFEELYKPIAYGSLFVSFPLPMQRKGWICQTCHYTWEDAAPEPDQEITPPTW
jgi:hypothetical protein